MSSPNRPARRLRKPPKLVHDWDRPEPDPEEVIDVQSISGDSDLSLEHASAMPSHTRTNATPVTPRSSQLKSASSSQPAKQQPSSQDIIDISTDGSVVHHNDTHNDLDMSDFEDVDVAAAAVPQEAGSSRMASEDLEMENVELDLDKSAKELQDMYAAAYQDIKARYGDETDGYDGQDATDDEQAGDQSSPKAIPIFKDGKGQHRGVEISVGSRTSKQTDKAKPKSNNLLTPRDRQNRITAHKLLVLSVLAHTRVRNKWCNDADLRDTLAESVPDYLITKLRSIHPKKVMEQRERIRMFESFLSELVRWWSGRFRLDPTMVANSALRQPDQDIATGIIPGSGRRIDGWLVETAVDREQRHRRERRMQQRYKEAKERQANMADPSGKAKGKGKASHSLQIGASASSTSLKPPTKAMEITIFAPGSAIRPIYLRLLPAAEEITSPHGLRVRAEERSGSRETSVQLFCALCRSIGIPARLVVSPQPLSWSVGASKLANTAQPGSREENKINQLRARAAKGNPGGSRKFASKPLHELTSDEDGDFSASGASTTSRSKRPQNAISIDSLSSVDEAMASDSSDDKRRSAVRGRAAKDPEDLTKKAVLGAVASTSNGTQKKRGSRNQPITVGDTQSDASSNQSTAGAKSRKVSNKAAASPSAKRRGKSNQTEPIEVDSPAIKDDAGEDDDDYRPEKWKNLETPLKVEHKVKLRSFRPKQLKDSEVAGDGTTENPVDLQASPTMWVEVFSKPYQKWITVDPIRSLIRPSGNRHMEPPAFDRQNKLIYVVAFEEDGYARDVTARYTKTLNSRVSRLRPPTRAKGEEEWWSKVARAIHRPQKLDRDAMEDAELQDNASREPMPSSMNGFKDHPIYFLEKFLKRDEVVFPRRQIATFQGTPVFSKSDVQTLRSSRQWFNEGRVVKDGEIALKFVKSRGYTLANKRAEEQARLEGREVAQEGLYAEFQTQLYVPPPVGDDGVIPTNGFGNIDLFVPSMLPAGAAHLPFSGVAKVAKKLGVPYAEAITGFEFRKQRGMPKITGIVVAQPNAELVEEAFWQQEQQDALKQQTKKMERAMKNWRKLINAVRIAKRVKEQYGDKMMTKPSKEASASPSGPGSRKKVSALKKQMVREQAEEKSRFFAPKPAAVAVETEDTSAAEHALPDAEYRDPDIEMEDRSSPPAAHSAPSSATSTPAKRGKVISLAQLASTSGPGGDDNSGSSSASPNPSPPVEEEKKTKTKRPRRQTQTFNVEESVGAKRPRRSAAAAGTTKYATVEKEQEADTTQRRSSRRQSGKQQVYVEPLTDDEGEGQDEMDNAVELASAKIVPAEEHVEAATPRRTSRRITVKLTPKK
ncbi:related to RAD4 - Excision repair protein [Melanopsichium pennsylvanicum]|uniref:Related to RAD4 - Excision repair protein n=2 Tax=Melanopsichium pennsylvanicum TaxID=63383 RepID=A0AAJ4XQ80_9BASI|nr:related to RAD4-Excision repair protein (N-terminal fragment) [Melanopsichium pennsylvanicum 4]SNX86515.1 related to RAD4 - Excision repair protein [Melanopsichium pennsylvanicum]